MNSPLRRDSQKPLGCTGCRTGETHRWGAAGTLYVLQSAGREQGGTLKVFCQLQKGFSSVKSPYTNRGAVSRAYGEARR